MYVVSVKAHYDSAHYLRRYQGKCERMHGHRYEVELALMVSQLDDRGLAFDFTHMKDRLEELAGRLDHRVLNEVPPFTEKETTAENQARFFFDELKKTLPPEMAEAMLYVRVWEAPTQFALYSDRQLFI